MVLSWFKELAVKFAAYKAEDWSAARLPVVKGVLNVPGLQGEVTVLREKGTGVPHISATNDHDVYFAQGFIHASERLWQMHLLRTLAFGRLSEAFGERALDTDRFARALGWGRLARSSWEDLLGEEKAKKPVANMVRSYVEGVNAFLAHGESKLPVEFMLASITPRPWTCVEVLAAERLMGFQLSCGFQQKIIRGKLMSLVGPLNTAYFHHFDPDVPTSMSELNDEKVDMSEGLEQVFADIDAIWAINDPADGSGVPDVHNRGQGSNAWAISGTKTESGKPLLAGDPHLKLAQPHIWSVHHLLIPSAKKGKDDALNCFGVTLPGFPGIVMGRNQHMAYSITLSYVDVEDLFLEKVRTDDASYLYKDSWKPIKFVKEDIVVKGRAEVVPFTASYTHHGPILSDIIPKFVSGTGAPWPVDDQVLDDGKSGPYVLKISLASKTLLPVSKTTFAAYFMNRASNWKQFRAACGQMTTPLLNFVYADVHGDIGYSMPGDCPIREKKHSGLLPAPGWTGECEWLGSIPKAEMPYSLNPEQGFIVSCNHKATPEDYPYYMGALFWPGFRARVATNHLEQKATGWTVQDCKDLQMNVYSMHGKLFVDLLREAKFDLNKLFDPAYRINSNYEVMATALGVLFDWNYELDAGSTGACVYEVWIYCLMHTIFGTGLKKAYMQKNDTATDEQAEVATSLILGFLKGDPFNETLKVKNEIGTFSHSALLRILSQDACGEQWSSFKSMPGQAEAWKERPTGWKPSNYWLDTCGGFDAVLLRTLMQVVKICGARFGPQAEVSSWTWGGMHALNLKHALSKRLGPDPFDCGAYPIGGDMLTLNLASSSLDGTFDACRVAGVSWRLVVDFSDMQNSQWMMPCGNSGHVSSPHYNDLTDRFLAGQFERAIMDAGELAESGKEMMVLRLTSTAATTGLVREERSERSKRKKKNPIAKPLLTLVAIIALFLWLAYSAGVDWVAAVESVGAYAWKLVLDPMHPLRGWIVGGDCDADHPGL